MTNPARFDLRAMSALQKEIHEPVRAEDGGESIATVFADLFQPALRNSSLRINLTRVASNKSSVDYIVDANIHYLLMTYLDQELPTVKVAKAYAETIEIAWTPYVGLNLFRTASLKYGDLQPNTLTPLSMYFWAAWLVHTRRVQALFKQVGHTEELTAWAKALPSARLFVPLPWYYATHPSKAFPFYRLKEKKELTHQFDFVGLKDLLRVRRLVDGEWRDVPYDDKYIELPPDSDGRLPVPELYGRAAMVEDDELRTGRCAKEVSCFFDTFKLIESTIETVEGRTAEVSLDCEEPCKAMLFGCISTQSKKTNQPLLFTSASGASPMATYAIKYGNSDRVPETELEHLEMDMWEYFPPNFDTAGLGLHLFDVSPDALQACSGPVFSRDLKAKLCVRLREESEAAPQYYKLVVLLWTTRKLVFTKDEKDEFVYNLALHPDPITE